MTFALTLVFPATAAFLIGAWAVLLPRVAIGLLFFSLVLGQLVRIPLPGQGGGVLVSDVAVIAVLAASLLTLLSNKFFAETRNQKPEIRTTPSLITIYCFPISFFLIWSLFTLIVHVPELGWHNSLIAGAYWVRLSAYLLLLPALVILFQDQKFRFFARRTLVLTVGTLVVIGFLQLIALPNLWDLSRVAPLLGGARWDPHQSRLVSTWLDPNFFGGFLVIALPWLIVEISNQKSVIRNQNRRVALVTSYWLLITASAVALMLTQSRSSLFAFAGAVLLLSPLVMSRLVVWIRKKTVARSVRIGVILILLALGAVFAGRLLGDRLPGAFTIDSTANLRLRGLAAAWGGIVEPNAWVGVGYNAYQFSAQQAGIIGDFSIHSRAGSDNSFLTIWATTGIAGLVLFSIPWLFLTHRLVDRVYNFQFSIFNFQIAGLFSLVALTIHAQFVNSFLYPHLLITIIVIITLALTHNPRTTPGVALVRE